MTEMKHTQTEDTQIKDTQIKDTQTKQFRFSPAKPFYAWVGASDLALEAVRKAATDLQLQLENRLNALQADAKALPERTQARLAELRTQLAGTLVERTPSFDELAARGHSVVTGARVETAQQVHTAAESVRETVEETVDTTVDTTVEAVQDTAAATQEVVDEVADTVEETAAVQADVAARPDADDEVVVSVAAQVEEKPAQRPARSRSTAPKRKPAPRGSATNGPSA